MPYRLFLAAPFALMLAVAPAAAGVPDVVTDMPVVQSLVAQVMGDLGSPAVLLEQGMDVHSFQLRPSQARAVATADLLIWVGPELTPWLQRTVAGVGLAGRSVELLHSPGTETRDFGAADGHAAHGEGGAGAEVAGDAGGDAGGDAAGVEGGGDPHGHSDIDPHAWLDPANARAWLDLIAAELGAADPDNAATYAANAAAAKSGVDRVEALVRDVLAPVGATPILVHHDAYGYFEAHFGVIIAGEIELGDASAPSARKLDEVRKLLIANAAACIFPEAQQDPGLLDAVTRGTGTRVGSALDPEGTSLPYGPGLYGELMTRLARSIADCVNPA